MIFLMLPVTSSLDNCCIVSLFIRRLMGHMMSPLVSGPIRGQRAQTIAGLPHTQPCSASAEKHKMFAGEALKSAGHRISKTRAGGQPDRRGLERS